MSEVVITHITFPPGVCKLLGPTEYLHSYDVYNALDLKGEHIIKQQFCYIFCHSNKHDYLVHKIIYFSLSPLSPVIYTHINYIASSHIHSFLVYKKVIFFFFCFLYLQDIRLLKRTFWGYQYFVPQGILRLK